MRVLTCRTVHPTGRGLQIAQLFAARARWRMQEDSEKDKANYTTLATTLQSTKPCGYIHHTTVIAVELRKAQLTDANVLNQNCSAILAVTTA